MAWNPKDDIFKQFAVTPDRELTLWEDWIKIRREEMKELKKRLMRPQVDLVMNKLEEVRPDKERKKVLEECQICSKVLVRGYPWEQASRFRQRCRCENVYEIVRTAAELGHPKIIQHIGCPDYIKEGEKGLLGKPERIVCTKLNAEYVKYRAKREEEWEEKIKKIDPYKPDTSNLVVIGRRPQTPPKKPPLLPFLEITKTSDMCIDAYTRIYAIRINKTVLIKDIPDQPLPHLRKMQEEPDHESCQSWTYYFNVPEQRIGRSKLCLENLGTVTLRYCWKKKRIMIPFIPVDTDEQKFFFYKNEDVISPGQSKTIFFTFVSEKAGIFNETWELNFLNICLFDTSAEKISFHLIGDAVENVSKITKRIEKLGNRIDMKVVKKFILNMLNEVFIEATSVVPQIYPYKNMLLEAEMFVSKNPVCYYHQTEVSALKDMYKEMTGNEWNLSIVTWRDALINKPFEERMNYYEFLKKSFSVLLKPWDDGGELAKQKHDAVFLLLGQLADTFYFEHERTLEWNGVPILDLEFDPPPNKVVTPLQEGPLTADIVRNIFYIRMYEHVCDTMELCAGMLSNLELNRWIDFDFCQT